ncbi:hypothetical protein M422DRAFT_266945 [Sphaerobolus stellatus SS14]|uniref:Uncharacterized protein n=1 Tax=Sphaerobolus stellatus (strain SS14) TaxID=990650 RepID=A0A0C9V1J5_SPHS4|nr:hypothetical protein M422DRAFT_266945 [Sphaerobolus stellatus SS14]
MELTVAVAVAVAAATYKRNFVQHPTARSILKVDSAPSLSNAVENCPPANQRTDQIPHPGETTCLSTYTLEYAAGITVTVATAAGFIVIRRGEDATGAVRDVLEAFVIPAEGKLDPVAEPVFEPDAAPIAATQVGAGRVLLPFTAFPSPTFFPKINPKTLEFTMPTKRIKHPNETRTQPKALHGMFFRPAPVADMDVVVGMLSLESLHG